MKRATAMVFALALATPAIAQDGAGTPLLRVYIDAPYFYDILADVSDSSDPAAHAMTLLVEGKEVGESRVIYDCQTGEYAATVVADWTGDAALFVPAALLAYRHLHC